MVQSEYLRHVDGLRALAVLLVIFFHFGVSGFAGGYIGVDIFFVISGFLITRIIRNELKATGDFNFRRFYSRRIRRLLPALIFTLLITTFVAVIIFTPENLAAYGASLASAVLSLSNVFFWRESGYFDTASHLKPLLHTWSLSVEEQFYLVWPALLCWAAKKKNVTGVTVGVMAGIISLMLSEWVVQEARPEFQSTIFYLTPFRVFEFSIGALGVFLVAPLEKNIFLHELMAIVGLILIIVSLLALDDKSLFPFINALPVCVGALLLILAEKSQLIRFLLGNKLVVGIGLISYSLYLMHWPVLVYTKYIFHSVLTPVWIAAMLVTTFVMALLSFRYVETPWRTSGRATKWFYRAVIILMLSLCVLGVIIKRQQGWEWRFHLRELSEGKEFFGVNAIENGKQRRYKGINSACSILDLGNTKKCRMESPVQILFLGNSHEPDAVNMFQAMYGDNPKINYIFFGTVNDCIIEFNQDKFSSNTTIHRCNERFARLSDPTFVNNLTHIVYNAYPGFDDSSKDMWKLLAHTLQKNLKIKLIAIGSYISTTIDCATLINKKGSFDACKESDVVNHFYPNEQDISTIPEVKDLSYLYISKYKLLCVNGVLSTCQTNANGEPMFYDQHHLSYGFSRHLGQLIGVAYRKELRELGLPELNN